MRNLLGRLLERSTNELTRIAAFWDVDLGGRDRYNDVAALYRTMTDVWAARDAWERTPPAGRDLIRLLHQHSGDARTPEELATELGSDPEDARNELRRLYTAGIVSVEDEDLTVGSEPGERALFLPREIGLVFERIETEQDQPVDVTAPLDELLATVPYPEIEEAASTWGARVTPGVHARAELVNIVLEQLGRPERIDRHVNNLSGPAREAWTRLKAAGGEMLLDDLLPNDQFPPSVRQRTLRELSKGALLWHTYREIDSELRRFVVIPKSILSPDEPEPAPVPDLSTADNADVSEPDWVFPYAAVWDLLTILREVTNGNPRWNALAEADPAIVRRLRSRLWLSDPETGTLPTGYLQFLVRIGAMLGVLQRDDNRAVPGPEAKPWRESAFTTAGRTMVSAWTSAENWVEGLNRVDLVMYGASWPAFRTALLRALGELDPDNWYDEASVIERLLRTEPDLLRQAQVGSVASSQLAMRLDQHREIEDRRAQVLNLVIGTTLETAGAWLNLVERSHEVQTGKAVIRLTAFGHWIAGPRSEPSIQQIGPAPLAVGANFEVLLYRPTPRRVWALSAFAELKALDRVSTYTLTAAALIRALAGGVDLQDVVRFLESQSGEKLPQIVEYTLAEWDRGYRRVWLRRSVLLEPEEGEESERIAEALRDAGLEPEVLTDGRLALVFDEPEGGERLFSAATRALRERGFAPLTEPDSQGRAQRRGRQGS